MPHPALKFQASIKERKTPTPKSAGGLSWEWCAEMHLQQPRCAPNRMSSCKLRTTPQKRSALCQACLLRRGSPERHAVPPSVGEIRARRATPFLVRGFPWIGFLFLNAWNCIVWSTSPELVRPAPTKATFLPSPVEVAQC